MVLKLNKIKVHCYLQESYTYQDPITEFVECLYVHFDFDGAQQKLRECETVSVEDKIYMQIINNLAFQKTSVSSES